MNRRDFGDQGERLAADFLRRKRYRILETNYSRPTGEIDIIARQGKTLVFIEVKRRSSLRYGRPSQAVDRGKQAHILRTAALYLKERDLWEAPMRFDVVEILPGENLPCEIRHIENAFDASALKKR